MNVLTKERYEVPDTDIAKPAAGTVYVLGVTGGVIGFYPFTGSAIPAGKAYYVVN